MINESQQQLDLTLANATSQRSKVDPLLRGEIVNLLAQLIGECIVAPATASDEERRNEQR